MANLTEAPTQSSFGSDVCPSGIGNLLGARPGPHAFNYEGPQFGECTALVATYNTTHAALAQLLPPPLEPLYDLPATVSLLAELTREYRGRDGRVIPYTKVIFHCLAGYKGHRGRAHLVEYVDGPNGDMTIPGEALIAAGIYVGMLKKLGQIRFQPLDDGYEVTCDRRGARLLTMRIRRREEMPPEQRKLLASTVFLYQPELALEGEFGVREIPTPSIDGYIDRSVWMFPVYRPDPSPTVKTKTEAGVKRVWAADASIELGYLELDPLDLMPIVGMGPAAIVSYDLAKDGMSSPFLIERLSTEV